MNSIRKVSLLALSALTAGLLNTTALAEDGVATPDEVVTKVWGAAKVLQTKGVSAISELNNAEGRWVWKDSYLFAFDCRLDRMVAHPMRPDLVGRPIMQITDNNGKFIFKELCEAAKTKNGGWVEYQWTKPGAGQTSRKLSYAATAELAFSTGVQIAAGVYDDSIAVSDLNKMTTQMSDPGKYAH